MSRLKSFESIAAAIRGCSARLAIVVLLLAPTFAPANPLTLNFTGSWLFQDPQQHNPAFHAAMSTVGVFDGTPVSWSLTIDDAPVFAPLDPTYSEYSVFGSELFFGSLALKSGPSAPGVPSFFALRHSTTNPMEWYLFSSGAMGPPVAGYTPDSLQFFSGTAGPNFSSTPIGTMQNILLIIGFEGGSHAGYATNLTYVGAVPEPEIYAMLGVGLAVLGWIGKRKRPQSTSV